MGTRDQKQSVTIFESEDFLSFLKRVIDEKKQSSRSFSLRRLAKDAEISSSLLSLVLSGKRSVSLGTAEGLAKALSLRGRRRTYFIGLAKLHNARTDEERWTIQNELIRIKEKTKHGAESPLQIKQYRLISRWYYSALYVLIGLKNISQSPELLARRLGRGVTKATVEETLRDLEAMELIKREEGRLVQTNQSLSTGTKNRDAALFQYHHQMLKLAMMSLKLPSQRREFRGLTVAIPKSQMKVVKTKIQDFLSDLNAHLSEYEEADQVYQVNLQLFELSDPIKEFE